jgi:hypothetical protein
LRWAGRYWTATVCCTPLQQSEAGITTFAQCASCFQCLCRQFWVPLPILLRPPTGINTMSQILCHSIKSMCPVLCSSINLKCKLPCPINFMRLILRNSIDSMRKALCPSINSMRQFLCPLYQFYVHSSMSPYKFYASSSLFLYKFYGPSSLPLSQFYYWGSRGNWEYKTANPLAIWWRSLLVIKITFKLILE